MKFGSSGIHDWLAQRLTAVVLLAYIIFLTGFWLSSQPMDFFVWQSLFHNTWMKVATVLAIVSVAWHAWIGLWTITTDYVKPKMLRLVLQWIFFLSLLGYVVWGLMILWGKA
ncbi:MAG: succinate dehydrogenase, hydrophobic membrane anchor protein [Legionellales bacterium]|nr:succinate dehydrogenase, hydrophobic membrane anchor protein [Legionellales bacterium]|tara:strand:- start:84 stop:419 length:336 start_codon:yes stop_codon:yes gene_type:complete